MGNTNIENQDGFITGTFNQALMIMKRFPVSALSSITLFIISFLANHKKRYDLEFPEYELLVSALFCAFISAGIVNVYLHYKDGKIRLYQHLVAFIVASGLGMAVYYYPLFELNFFYFIIALVLLFLITPFKIIDTPDDVIWKHIAGITGAYFMSALIGNIFGLALVLIGWTLKSLFFYRTLADNPADIWILSTTLISPIVGLVLLPNPSKRPLQLPDAKALYSRSYTFLMNYILAPLIVLYLIILHIYAATIVLTWTLPRGNVAQIVVIFSLMLVGFVLLMRPWQERATTLTNWILNLWGLLLLTPIVMLAIAIIRRISDYGFTPARYVLLIIGAWLVILFIWSIFKRKQLSSISILTSLTAMLFFTSFGPWGMSGISLKSQTNRFISLLNKYELVENGRLIENYKEKLTFTSDENRSAQSILSYFSKNKQLDILEPLFEGLEDNPFNEIADLKTYEALYKIKRAFNPNNVNNKVVFAQNINFISNKPGSIDIAVEGKLFGLFTARYYKNTTYADKSEKIVAWVDKDYLHTQTPEGTWKIELKQLEEHFEPLSDKKGFGLERFVLEKNDQKLEFIFKILNLRRSKNKALDIMNTEYFLIVHKNPS